MASSSPSQPTIALVTMIDDEEDFDDQPKKIKKINNYIIAKCIGSGSFSKVYLGIDITTKKKYAIKRIKLKELCRSSSGIAQLEREIRLMESFNHKNILKLYQVLHVEATHYAYLVLEYAKKGSLGSLLDKDIHLSHKSVFSIMKQILSALKYLHQSGFVHQDIKPANILIDENGRAILADFGIGHSFQSAAMVVGSPAFQAPECLDDSSSEDNEEDDEEENEGKNTNKQNYHNGVSEFSELDPKKEDVWSLGVTLYQLLFNKLPFEGDNLFEIVQYIKSSNLHFPPNTDKDIILLIKGMLTVDPSKRFSVDDVMKCPLISQADDLATEIANIPDSSDVPNIDSLIEAANISLGPKASGYAQNDKKIGKKNGQAQIQKYKTLPNLNGIEQIEATVCPEGYSFASVAMSIQRRLSCMNAPYSPDFHRRPEPFPRPSRSIDNLNFDDKQHIQKQQKNEFESQQQQQQHNLILPENNSKIISFKKMENAMKDKLTRDIIATRLIRENDEKAVPPC
ncbi:hypothetical protein M9Y10_011744 [Tritrichomonas musculus]|uniref:Protein kinase domain-containing protein n=1 Tax=Tritrichomonas musculus TaxID=1915356 RepID=A0ABR2ILX6_9EUKA